MQRRHRLFVTGEVCHGYAGLFAPRRSFPFPELSQNIVILADIPQGQEANTTHLYRVFIFFPVFKSCTCTVFWATKEAGSINSNKAKMS
jgi:hypothetical protein